MCDNRFRCVVYSFHFIVSGLCSIYSRFCAYFYTSPLFLCWTRVDFYWVYISFLEISFYETSDFVKRNYPMPPVHRDLECSQSIQSYPVLLSWTHIFHWNSSSQMANHYLPKFTIFGKYVRLSVCLSVCPSVCLSVSFVKHNSWTLWHIITKLGPHMEWVSSSSMWHWQISRSWN